MEEENRHSQALCPGKLLAGAPRREVADGDDGIGLDDLGEVLGVDLFGLQVGVIPRVRVHHRLVDHHANFGAESSNEAADEFDDRELVLIQRREATGQVHRDRVIGWGVETQLLLLSHRRGSASDQ